MSFLILLLVLSYFCTVFITGESSGTNILKLIESNCDVLDNFNTFLRIDSLCSQPKLSSDELKNRLLYDSSPLLCIEYHLVIARMCNQSNLESSKNEGLPRNKEGAKNALNEFQNKFVNVEQFCAFTESNLKKMKFSETDNQQIEDIFVDVVGNVTSCKGFCRKKFDDHVSDLCSVIIWARELEKNYSASVKDKSTTAETHIERLAPLKPENVSPVISGTTVINRKTSDKVNDERKSNLKLSQVENNLSVSRKTIAFADENIHPNLENSNQMPNTNQSVENNKKVSETGNIDGSSMKYDVKLYQPDTVGMSELNVDGNHPKDEKTRTESVGNQQNQNENKNITKDKIIVDDFNANTNNKNIDEDDKENIQVDETNLEIDSSNKIDKQEPMIDDQGGDDDQDGEQIEDGKQVQEQGLIDREALSLSSYHNDRLGENEDSHFFTYFVSMGVVCGIMYILFHNKKKILALAVEGRRGRSHGGGRRRPNTAAYSKLDCNLEEAMVSNVSQASVTHVLY